VNANILGSKFMSKTPGFNEWCTGAFCSVEDSVSIS
jgi:hypothetical protein